MSIPMVWRRRAWRDRALRWAERRLGERDIHLTGKPDQFHVRSWSTVIRLPTDRGPYFFKAVWRPLRFEAGLTAAIGSWAPSAVGVPVAVDARRGWLLLEDGGQRLREILAKNRDIRHWHRILPPYAELQIALAPHARHALKLGTPDRRAKALAAQFTELLERPSFLRVGLKEGLTKAQDSALRDLVPKRGDRARRSGSCRTRSSTTTSTTARCSQKTVSTGSWIGATRASRIRSSR